MSHFTPSSRSRIKRSPERANYDKKAVFDVLDAGILAHIGYHFDGQTYVTPTFYWRVGETVYWHGSTASRMIRSQADGLDVCVTVTHLDGLVLARSAFNHSANYRSVMAFGKTRSIASTEEKSTLLDLAMRRIVPNRVSSLRPNTEKELKTTSVIAMDIIEAAAKVRSGPPEDNTEDYTSDAWAGTVNIAMIVERIADDPQLRSGIERPSHLSFFKHNERYDQLLLKGTKK